VKAVREVVVGVTPEQMMAVITDFTAYPDHIPHMTKARVLAETVDSWEVAFAIHVVRDLEYTLRLVRSELPDGRLRLDWSMVQGVFRSNDGSWTLEAVPEGTRATYEIALQIGMFVPRSIQNTLVRTGLPGTLAAFKRWAEATPSRPGSAPAGG